MNVTIVGLGVIGGSYALSLADNKKYNLFGIDIDESCIKNATENNIIKDGAVYKTEKARKIIKNTDLLILCIYPDSIISFLKMYKSDFKNDLVITDVTGIKDYFKDKALKLLPDHVDFVFSHPMAGREKKGFEYASKEVFKDANFIITPIERNSEKNIEIVQNLAIDMEFGTVKKISSSAHDKIISFTSQLPHAIAVSLVNSDDLEVNTGEFTGDSYRELTRIAKINEDLWSQLFLGNKENLLESIEKFETELDKIKKALKENNAEILKELFINSTLKREQIK